MKSRISYLILMSIFLINSLFFMFYGKIWTDENWYYSGAVMVSKGLLPNFDFFSHHTPLYFYIYAVPQYLFGPSLLAGRIMSLILTFFIFIFVYIIAKRLAGNFAALLAGAFLTLNSFSINYFVTSSYHAIESLFMVLFFFFLVSDIREKYKYSICTILLLLTIGVRYIIDISTIFLFLYFIFLSVQSKNESFSFKTQILIATSIIILLVLPHLIIYKKWFFQSIQYPIAGTAGAKSAMLTKNSLLAIIFYRIFILKKLLGNFLPVLVVIFSTSVGMIWLLVKDREKFAQFWRENMVFSMMTTFVIISELFYQIPLSSWPVTRLYYFPVACIVAGIFFEKLVSFSKNTIFKPLFYALPIVLIFFSVFTQEMPNVRASWSTSHLKYLGQISSFLRENTPKDAEIFTFDPPFVIEAGRKLSLNMLMETWQILPKMSTEKCKKYGLINIDMILEELNYKKPYALLLRNPGRLEDSGGKGRILIPYRDVIWTAINKNYYLAHTIPMKKNVDGVVNIYFRR